MVIEKNIIGIRYAKLNNVHKFRVLLLQMDSINQVYLTFRTWKKPIKVIPFLVLNEKMVELETVLPPKGRRIRAIGKVLWYDFGSRRTSYYFRAGIFLEKMGVGDRISES